MGGVQSLHELIQDQKFEDLKKVLENENVSDQINKRSEEKATPLELACHLTKDLEIFSLLVKKGADVNSIDQNRNTSIHHAMINGQSREVIQLLLSGYDLDLNERNLYGLTPMFYLNQKTDYRVIKELVDCGANLNIEDEDGNTPIMYALFNNCKSNVIDSLAQNGSDLYHLNQKKQNSLHYAITIRSPQHLIKSLIEQGGHELILTQNELGENAIRYAKRVTCMHNLIILMERFLNEELSKKEKSEKIKKRTPNEINISELPKQKILKRILEQKWILNPLMFNKNDSSNSNKNDGMMKSEEREKEKEKEKEKKKEKEMANDEKNENDEQNEEEKKKENGEMKECLSRTGCMGKFYKSKFEENNIRIEITFENSAHSMEIYFNEANILSRCNHKNIIKFYGGYLQKENLCLVTEHFQNSRSLFEILHSSKVQLSKEQMIKIALDLSHALNYLHNNRIILGNISSLNLLTSEKIEITKIADLKNYSNYYNWKAPEILLGQPESIQSNIYSFGIILYEIESKEIPFEDLNSAQLPYFIGNQRNKPTFQDLNVFSSLIPLCLETNPENRISISEIIDHLNQL